MKIDLEALKKSSEELDRTEKYYSISHDSLTQDLIRYCEFVGKRLEEIDRSALLKSMVDQYRSDLNMLLVDYEVK